MSTVAVIADIRGSRRLETRAIVQRDIEAAFARADAVQPALQPLRPTVADEFQGVWNSLPAAVVGVLAAQLALPDGVQCRFGLGLGEVRAIEGDREVALQDGPGWWLAREAIDRSHRNESGKLPASRTWLCTDPEDAALAALVNALFLARDELVVAMSDRARRITFARLVGASQQAIADDEGISASAVSQTLRRSGATALIAGITEIGEVLGKAEIARTGGSDLDAVGGPRDAR